MGFLLHCNIYSPNNSEWFIMIVIVSLQNGKVLLNILISMLSRPKVLVLPQV